MFHNKEEIKQPAALTKNEIHAQIEVLMRIPPYVRDNVLSWYETRDTLYAMWRKAPDAAASQQNLAMAKHAAMVY